MNRQIIVSSGAAPRRLDVYLAEELGYSRTTVSRLFKAGLVRLQEKPMAASYNVKGGEIIDITEPEPVLHAVLPPPDLPIIYEDVDILVIDKPAGVIVHAGNGQSRGGTVADFARLHTTDTDPERPGIIHRLDKETSGLLVIAKTNEAKLAMQQHWQDHLVQKTYQLLVVGRPDNDEATINLPLDRDVATPTKRSVSATGRPAVTNYRTQAVYPGYTSLVARPETGRTHQLRVHFAALGHPIAGDVVYGPAQRPLGLKRHFLHAARLAFTTPSGKAVELESPLPSELQLILAALEAKS